MDTELNRYICIIIDALNQIRNDYFLLPTTYQRIGIVRERVFCYEFYYHLRTLMREQNEESLTLNGEIDKSGHPLFSNRQNPDFVFHIPGQMESNSIVIEVKGKADGQYKQKCIKDFETLSTFVKDYQYKCGIFILYNYTLSEFISIFRNSLRNKFNELEVDIKTRILIICKKNCDVECEADTLQNICT